MSTTSIISEDNLSTNKAINEYFVSQSLDLLKKLRFDVGKVCHSKLKYMMRLHKLACNQFCSLNDEQKKVVREDIINKAILKLDEL